MVYDDTNELELDIQDLEVVPKVFIGQFAEILKIIRYIMLECINIYFRA